MDQVMSTDSTGSLQPYISGVNRVCHDFHPAFKGGHLKQGEVGPANMVKLHLGVAPHGVVLREAGLHVRYDLGVDGQAGGDIKALSSLRRLVLLVRSVRSDLSQSLCWRYFLCLA